MGYVGRGLNQDGGQYRKLDSIESSFDGSEVNFTLKIDGLEVSPTAQNLMISVGGVVQEPGTAFSVSGATITFATAPDEDATFFGVLMGEASFIAANTVGSNEMGVTAGAVTGSKGIVVDTAKNIIGLNNVSASKFEGTFDGALSSSAQIAANISGSFSKEHLGAKVANVVTSSAQIAADISGSFGNQRVGTGDSPTFAGGTITGDFAVGGTLTAQEVHTEFESASILFTSGSTQFGNSSDDVHDFLGNTISGSATSTGSFGSIVIPGNVDFNGDLDVDGTTNLDVVDIDGAVDMASTLAVANTLTVTTDNENVARFDGLQGNIDFRYGSDIEFDRAGQVYITANNGSGELNFRTGGQNIAMHIDNVQNIGIGATPTTFHSSLTGVQIGGNGILQHETSAGASKTFKIAQNVREEITSGDFTYISTDEASLIELNSGGVNIKTAPSGTAGATATMTSRFTVLQDGKTGIGTASPDTLLNLKDTGGIEVRLEADSNNSGQEDCFIRFYTDGKTQEGIVGMDNNNSSTLFNSNTENAMVFGCVSNLPVVFATNNTERMQISAAGNVGINQTNPSAKIDINQDDNAHSIYIDSEATTAHTISIQAPALTTAYGISMYDMDDLTSGGGLYVHSNGSNTGSRKLVHAINQNSSATGTTVLHIQQQAGCEAVVIDQNGNSSAMYIDGENTTTPAVHIVCDVLTSGEGLRVYSGSPDGSNRNLVEIINDHASADNTRGLYIQNDGALYGIEMAGGCGIRFDNTVPSSDASTLDDYEEGTITPTLLGASDPTQTYQSRGGFYTKIGNRVFFSIRIEMNGSGITPGSGTCYIGGLPFTVRNDVNNYGAVNIGYTNAWLTGQHGAPTTGYLSINSTTIFLLVYDNDSGNQAASVNADAADVDDGTTITLSGHYIVA